MTDKCNRGEHVDNLTTYKVSETAAAHLSLIVGHNSILYPFTPERFHVLLTLSSKFFSTVPQGTCLLSDSWLYLALDGVYHLLWTAIPNNPTLRTTITNDRRHE